MLRTQWGSFISLASWLLLIFVPITTIGYIFFLPLFFSAPILMVALFVRGLIKFDINHAALVVRFGRRIRGNELNGTFADGSQRCSGIVLNEGWNAVIPFLETAEEINLLLRATRVMQRISKADGTVEDKIPEVLCRGGKVTPNITIYWRVIDDPGSLYHILSIGESVIQNGLMDAVLSDFRFYVKGLTPEKILGTDEDTDRGTNEQEVKSISKRFLKAAKKKAKDWEIKIEDVVITDITFSDALEEAMSDRATEFQKMRGVEARSEMLRQQAMEMVKNSSTSGATISFSEAMRRVLAISGNQKMKEAVISGGTGNALTDAVAINKLLEGDD